MKPELKRQVFTTSRELEYFSESELVTQTGHQKEDWWPGVLVKELVDNSLDACEQASIPPKIEICLGDGELTVSDNGPGIPPDVLFRILDFSTRTSDKAAYVSPTRGAQGNALKTILAIPYVLNGGKPATIEIDALGLKHLVTVSTDHIARRPQIDHETREVVKIDGTAIRLKLDSASIQPRAEDAGFLQRLITEYSLFNPHATFVLSQDGRQERFEATAPGWRKWLPGDPTSAHWYNLERRENLVASYIALERLGGESKTVREFISEFRGLSSTVKQKHITAEAHLDRAYLHDLVAGQGQLDHSALTSLLGAMQQASAPVKPDSLGVLGDRHFRQRLQPPGSKDQSFRYKRLHGSNPQNLPYVVECAFCMTDDPMLRGSHIGLNWSASLGNPLQEDYFDLGDGDGASGLSALLSSNRISVDRDPICLALHLICPKFTFLDRGKGSVNL